MPTGQSTILGIAAVVRDMYKDHIQLSSLFSSSPMRGTAE
ncbi:MAG: hypothetical protein GPOALKHO_001212 [Sodalis sp.]|nr:MAG: hypothetical protein GPOALKHO_001212 [Sodalis sp.]